MYFFTNLLVVTALLQSVAATPSVKSGKSDTLSSLLGHSKFIPKQEKFIHKEHSVHHKRADIVKRQRARGDVEHEVIFNVKQNMDEITKLVDDVSNPFSANYGNHLTKAEVTAMTSNPASRQHIIAYLKLHDVTVDESTASTDYIKARAPVSKWETMFATEFFEFEMQEEEQRLIRATTYSVPENIHAHVASVFNTVQFPYNHHKTVIETPLAVDSHSSLEIEPFMFGYTTPALINEVYDIRNNIGSNLTSQAVFEQQLQAFSPSDLTLFQEAFNLTVEGVAIDTSDFSDDNSCLTHDCYEGNLDVQYIMAVSQETPTTYFYWNGTDFLLEWITMVAAMDEPPLVISISWGGPEMFYSESYITAFNTEAIKLSAMGVTIVTSSGDDGAASYPARFFDGGVKWCAYNPDFPSVSYYVTSVGATMGPENKMSEVACMGNDGGVITTGGGFSTQFSAPSWQSDYIASYFENAAADGTTPFAGYNAVGRGFPDISFMGVHYVITVAGEFTRVSGTSASSPVFGGMLSLINARRLEAGKSALGWINPALYAFADSYVNDITKGHNKCTVLGEICCEQGFTSTVGWDPVTGLGSLNFTAFEEVFFALGDNYDHPTESPSLSPAGNSPTIRPTKTSAPTESPTVMPTASSGWLYGTYYDGLECEGNKVRVEAWRTGKCFSGYYDEGFAGYYLAYSCDSVAAHLGVYSDSDCSSEIISFIYGINSCAYQNNYYYAGETDYSYAMLCSDTSTIPLDTANTYTMQSWYNNIEECNPADVTGFDAYLNNHCFSRESNENSFKYNYPNLISYDTSASCEGDKTSTALYTVCVLDAVDDASYYINEKHYGRSYRWSKMQATSTHSPTVSPAPSEMPTYKPTLYVNTKAPVGTPTVSPASTESYAMTVVQGLNGLNATEFNEDYDDNTDAFCASVADSMDGIEMSDCAITSIADSTTARKLNGNLRSLAEDDSLEVTYTVDYNIDALGYSGDAEGAYDHLIDQLTAAVEGSDFNDALVANSATYDAPAMESATSGEIESSSYESTATDSNDDNNDDKKKSHRDVIIGVVVGVGGGLICIALIAAFVFSGKTA